METYLGKPGLVRETSRVGALGSTVHFLRRVAESAGKFFRYKAGMAPAAGECWSASRATSGRAEAVRAFQDVVLTPDLKEQVRRWLGFDVLYAAHWSFLEYFGEGAHHRHSSNVLRHTAVDKRLVPEGDVYM